jgi:hypothetical protein
LQYPKIKHIVSDAQSLDPLKDVGNLKDKVCGVALLTFGDLDPQNIVTGYNSTRYH